MSTPIPAPYTPPAELITAAEKVLAQASPGKLATALTLYTCYGSVTGGRSAVTGAELPPFEKCSVLVRAGWLAVAEAINTPVASVTGAPVVPLAQVPSIGRIVHYCLGDEAGVRKGEVRPAIVVATRAPDPMTPNLQVLGDGPNDGFDSATGHGGEHCWRGTVPFGGPDKPGTWFWPPRV
ncbi:hypothetical protein [Corallococcus aberystwythensis]|uniref:Uncharacterized protein n=1 Tax=Corallococcus aberystwythensis TaxID=2316722 RepID=A0A3A8Q629_9BACT|nr:hypothetical protein [Corallococcus aberystwythensis]RKH64106.1 hypothetical protein D7W81_19090 [Corallococcus aberystwythensis]